MPKVDPALSPTADMLMNALRFFAVCACAVVIGCESGSQGAHGVHQISWSIWSADSPSVAGLDKACVFFGTFGDNAAIALWTDGTGGSFGAGWDKTREAVRYSGSLLSHDARNIDVKAFTADGKTGDVTIDGREFDLAKGSLFLVKTADGKTQIRQSTLQLPRSPPAAHKNSESASDTLREFAKSNKDITEFFGSSNES